MAESIVRAAAYYRMSTDRQEDSIERQRSNVLPYAERKGYHVLAESYDDEGIAGDEFERRAGLQRLLRDAAAGRFDVIVCDEVSRVSRQKFTEFMAKVAYPLEQAGVTVDTVAEGPLGWDEVVDILKLTIFQTNASGESKKLSYRTLTGMANLSRQGRLHGGRPPFGYKVQYETVELPGRPPRLMPMRLVPDGYKADVVRWIFDRYAAGATLPELAQELNGRCRPPRGGRWSKTTLFLILKNPRYTGCLTWNRATDAKHYNLAGGRPAKARRRRGWNDPGEWIVVEGTHEALVSQELFDRVRDRLAGNRNGRDRSRRGGYVLSGLLQCGHCGRTLYGTVQKGQIVYTCEKKDHTGVEVCARRRVSQDAVVGMLVRVLQRAFLDPKHLAALRAETVRQERAERAPKNLNGLRDRIAELAGWTDQGRKNLAILPPDMVPGVVEKIREWDREHDRLSAELAQAERGGRVEAFDAMAEQVEAALWELYKSVKRADPAEVRAMIREMVARVVFRWHTRRSASGWPKHTVTGGVIHFLPAGVAEVRDAFGPAARPVPLLAAGPRGGAAR
jgi:DNA invertase Pin-like site-specific DNA recombinase